LGTEASVESGRFCSYLYVLEKCSIFLSICLDTHYLLVERSGSDTFCVTRLSLWRAGLSRAQPMTFEKWKYRPCRRTASRTDFASTHDRNESISRGIARSERPIPSSSFGVRRRAFEGGSGENPNTRCSLTYHSLLKNDFKTIYHTCECSHQAVTHYR